MRNFKLFSNNSNKETLVLDMGSHSIKAVVGKYENNKISIVNTFTIPILADTYIDGKINDMLEVKERIKKALQENNVKTKATICTIENSFVISREIVLPAIQKEDLKEMIYYEIGQYVPIELGKYVVQYKILEEFMEGDIDKIRILVAALPEEIALSHFELLEFLDLSPIALDLHSNGICKLLTSGFVINNMDNFPTKTIAVLDLGHNHINVIIIENGIYRFSRIIDLGAKNIDMIIANYLDINLEDIEKYKYAMKDVLLSKDEIAISNEIMGYEVQSLIPNIILDALRSNVENWIEEISHVFKYYTSRSATNNIDTILIYGGTAAFNGLEEYMTNSFNIPTFRVEDISNVEFLNSSAVNELITYLNAIASLIRR